MGGLPFFSLPLDGGGCRAGVIPFSEPSHHFRYASSSASVKIKATQLLREDAMSATQEANTFEKPGLPLREPSPWNLPNLLTALRFGLAIVMFVLIGQQEWLWT